MELLQECRFKNSFIFKYSKREGTKAFEMYDDDIPDDVKRRRNNEMLDLQNRISEEDNAEFIGRRVSVLVEGPSKSAAKRAAREGQPLEHSHRLSVVDGDSSTQDHQLHTLNLSPSPVLDHDPSLDDHHDQEPQTLKHASPEASRQAMQLTGRSECDRIVVFDGNPRLIGTTAEIEIHDCTSTTLMGSIVTRELQHGGGLLLPILS